MEPVDSGELTVPVVSEEIRTGTRQVATGQVRVTKQNLPHEEIIQQDLRREHVEVRRVQINKQVEGPLQNRQEGDTLIVPVMEEVLQVQKIWMLKEELHIRRTATTERHEERVTVNRETATVERVDSAGTVTNENPVTETVPAAESVPVTETVPAAESVPAATPRVTARPEVPSLLGQKGTTQRKGRGSRSILTKYTGE